MSSNTRPRANRDIDSVEVIAKWIRRIGLPLAILAWTGVVLLILWLAGHVIQSLLLLTVAALLAYALAPGVKLLERVMPRFLAAGCHLGGMARDASERVPEGERRPR